MRFILKTLKNDIRKQLEVDFICNLGSKRYYIKLAYLIHYDKHSIKK